MKTHELWLRTCSARSQSSGSSGATRERGASAVEYGLLITGIAAVIAVVVFAFGDSIHDTLFDDTCQKVVAERGQGDCI